MSVSQVFFRNKIGRVRAGDNGGYLENGGGNINTLTKSNLELENDLKKSFGYDSVVKAGGGEMDCQSSKLSKDSIDMAHGTAEGIERDRTKWRQVLPGSAMAKAMIDEVVSKCTVENGLYPGEEVDHMFRLYEGKLEVKVSKVAEWAGGMTLGLYTKQWLLKGEVIGVYKGRLTKCDGAYVLDLTVKPGGQKWVDADMGLGEISMFGRINEDIHGGEYNCELGADGVMRILYDLRPGTELLTRYGLKYNWDSIKSTALDELKKEFECLELGVELDWSDLSMARKSKCPLVKWAVKLIDGDCLNEELHSVERGIDWVGKLGAIAYLTSGTTYEKFWI